MKSLRITTAASILLLSALAPAALASGDSNLDTGEGSAFSRGPFGFSTNYDPIYETPPNDYGIWRDAYGGFRDSGNIPDNLFAHVKEPTWQETHRPKYPIFSGSVGGLGGGLGGLGGFGGLGGLGLGGLGGGLRIGGGLGGRRGGFGAIGGISPFAGLGVAGNAAAYGLGFPLGFGNTPVGVGASNTIGGPYQNALRTPYGFYGTIPGTTQPLMQTQQYMGLLSGTLPYNTTTIRNTTTGNSSLNSISQNINGQLTNLSENELISGNRATITTTGTMNGSSFSATTNGPNTGLTSLFNTGSGNGTSQPLTNFSATTTASSNGGNSGYLPGYGNQMNYSGYANQSSTTIGGGFATPATSGSATSSFFQNTAGASTIGGGFASPGTSGSARSVFYPSNLGATTIGGGFATPATSGSQLSAQYQNPNNTFGPGFGGLGYGGYGGGLGGGLGGFAGGTGNLAARFMGGGSDEGEYHSDGSLAADGGANTGIQWNTGNGGYGNVTGTMGTGYAYPASRVGGTLAPSGYGPYFQGAPANYGGSPALGRAVSNRGNGVLGYKPFGEIPTGQPRGAAIGTMGEHTAYSPFAPLAPRMADLVAWANNVPVGAVPAIPAAATVNQRSANRVLPNNRRGAFVAPLFGAPPLLAQAAYAAGSRGNGVLDSTTPIFGYYTQGFGDMVKEINVSESASGLRKTASLTTDLEAKLGALHLRPCEAIGSVIGSMRLGSGDMLVYGTKGTLRLAPDNSGSITFNSGEILTFTKAPADMRWLALRSAFIY